MAGTCPTLSPDQPFLTDMLGYIDCQSMVIGQGGYQALASPGAVPALMLTSLLTLFVALFGFRMLLGHTPSMRDGVIAAVKVGLVLMMASNWPAYQTLVYDVVLRAPGQIASTIAGSASLPSGAGDSLLRGLQNVDDEMSLLQQLGTGNPQFANDATVPTTGAPSIARQYSQSNLAWDPQRDRQLIANARTVFLVATVAAFGSVRLTAGIMLALGPLIVLFLLFEGTRGLVEGWLRVLAGAALGGLGITIVLASEATLLASWLPSIIARRQTEISTPTISVELLAAALIFALLLLAILLASARLAHGLRFPSAWSSDLKRLYLNQIGDQTSQTGPLALTGTGTDNRQSQTRAQAVADALTAQARREQGPSDRTPTATFARSAGPFQKSSGSETMIATPLGQGARRRVRGRVSAGASKRDNRA